MKALLVLMLSSASLLTLAQETNLTDHYWCFDANFMDAISQNDTLVVDVFLFDHSPIHFKENGKFERIAPPFRTCGNSKATKIDHLKGTWNLTEDVLTIKTKKKTISFKIQQKTESALTLSVLTISD